VRWVSQPTRPVAENPNTLLNPQGDYRVAVNVFNLTDRLNYVQAFGNRGVPAPGRTVIFSIGMTI